MRPVTPKQVIADLAGAMQQLAESRELRARMGAAGREHVQKSFSWDNKGEWLHELTARVGGLDRRVSTLERMQDAE